LPPPGRSPVSGDRAGDGHQRGGRPPQRVRRHRPAPHPTPGGPTMTERLDDLGPTVLLDRSSAPIPSSLHERLVARADDEGVLDVAYTTVDTRIGPLLLAASPLGLLRVAFALEGFDTVVAELADSVSPRVLRAPRRLDDAARQVDGYLNGTVSAFDLALDLR